MVYLPNISAIASWRNVGSAYAATVSLSSQEFLCPEIMHDPSFFAQLMAVVSTQSGVPKMTKIHSPTTEMSKFGHTFQPICLLWRSALFLLIFGGHQGAPLQMRAVRMRMYTYMRTCAYTYTYIHLCIAYTDCTLYMHAQCTLNVEVVWFWASS